MMHSRFFHSEYYMEPVLNKTESYRFSTITIDSSNTSRIIERELIRELEITYIGRRKELLVCHVLTTGVNIKSDQSIPNEQFIKHDIFAFGKLIIGVNEKAEIVKIYNLKEMQDRWNKKVKDLREHNAGFGFEIFAKNNSNLLRSEAKTLFFLNSKNMFGLYFHGLFGKNNINEMPIQRTAAILELDGVEVTEEIRADNRNPEFIITAQKSRYKQEKISTANDEIEKYEGRILYDNNNQLLDGFLEIESKSKKIKYSVVWVG